MQHACNLVKMRLCILSVKSMPAVASAYSGPASGCLTICHLAVQQILDADQALQQNLASKLSLEKELQATQG